MIIECYSAEYKKQVNIMGVSIKSLEFYRDDA
jgi:predicted nucleic acid-binding Zn ribbon protein